MEEPTKTNHYDFASRFVLFSGGLGVAFVFWIIHITTLIAGGGSWPLIEFSSSGLFFFNSFSWYLYIYLLIAVPILPLIIFFQIRIHTVLLVTTCVFVILVVLFAQRVLFPCAILYPILTFFAYRFDRRRSAASSGLVQS